MAMSDTARDASPDDGIRVRGVPADDFLFADEVHDVQSICRPTTGAQVRTSTDLAYQCQCQPNAAESREFRKVSQFAVSMGRCDYTDSLIVWDAAMAFTDRYRAHRVPAWRFEPVSADCGRVAALSRLS